MKQRDYIDVPSLTKKGWFYHNVWSHKANRKWLIVCGKFPVKKDLQQNLIFNKNKIEWKTKFSFDVEFGSWYNFSIHINNFPKRGYFPARAWVGSLKQRVPITSKSSKFKGAAQHYVVKLPKFRGCKAPLAPVLTPTKSNQIWYAQRKWMSQVTIYFFQKLWVGIRRVTRRTWPY